MRAKVSDRLATAEARLGAVAAARERERQSRAFWTWMKRLSEDTGHDFLAGAFPRGYDPTAPPPRRPTARDRMDALLTEAQAFIDGVRAPAAEAAPARRPAPDGADPPPERRLPVRGDGAPARVASGWIAEALADADDATGWRSGSDVHGTFMGVPY